MQTPLKGIMMGNALVVPQLQFPSQPEMAYTGGGGSFKGGIVNKSEYELMKKSALDCQNMIAKCNNGADRISCIQALAPCVGPMMKPVMDKGLNPYDLRKTCPPELGELCYDLRKPVAYLNDPKVQKALGVGDRRHVWESCNMEVDLPFAMTGDLLSRFDQDVSFLLQAGVYVVAYNGDCDYMCVLPHV